jgi:PKD repeat protein
VLNVTPTSGTAPLVASIDSSASQGGNGDAITGRTIDFGDGTWVNSVATTSHTYTKVGNYTVRLTLKNEDGLTATASKVVTVTGQAQSPAATAPVPVLNVTPTSGTAPLVVSIDSSASTGGGSTITGRTIDFGDGTWVNYTPTTTHTYTKAGSYTVRLTLKNQAGLTATASNVVTVTASGASTANTISAVPVPVLNVSAASGTAPLVVTIDSSASQGGASAIIGRTIDFGDGTWLNWTPTTTHTYTKTGNYTVRLTLKTQAGMTATASSVIAVH